MGGRRSEDQDSTDSNSRILVPVVPSREMFAPDSNVAYCLQSFPMLPFYETFSSIFLYWPSYPLTSIRVSAPFFFTLVPDIVFVFGLLQNGA